MAAGETRDTKITGLILAAGRGSRLGEAAHSVPKCLLEIGRRPLIEHQLDALADAGVGPTVVVAGYGADEVRETVGLRAEYIVNTRWSATNSLYSLWLARERISGPLLILNSDVLFAPEILERLFGKEGDVLAIDSGSGKAREQMKVKLGEGRLLDMRKDLPLDEASGENVGILKLTAETAAALFEIADRLIAEGHHKSWLGAAVRELACTRTLFTVDVAGLPWVEIDFPVDLVRARKEVWPAIEGSAWKGRLRWKATSWIAALLLVAAGILSMALPAPPRPVWDIVMIETLEHTKIESREHEQSWWVLEGDRRARFAVRGPEHIRIDTRLLDPEEGRAQYVVEIELDGQRFDWFLHRTRVSRTATHPEWKVGRRKRISMDLPEGAHEIRVRLVAPETGRCLVRVRQLEELGDC